MTGDIPPAILLGYIFARLGVSLKEPKQQHWLRANVFTDDLGSTKAVWPIVPWDSEPPASIERCQIKDAQGRARTFEYGQSGDGVIYWAEMPEDDLSSLSS